MPRVCGSGLISALAASAAALGVGHAYADNPFNSSPFSSSSSSSAPPQASSQSPTTTTTTTSSSQPSCSATANAVPPRAKALREINSSSLAKKVF